EAVPPDVGHFDVTVRFCEDRAAESVTASAEQPESRQIGRLVAAFVEPLHAQADAEQRPSLAHTGQDRLDPGCIERSRGAEVTDARDDDAAGVGKVLWRRGHGYWRADRGERFLHRCKVARLVVDQGDHRSPLVLGSMRASRRSFAQATRSARANALNTASILWWLERP